MADRSRPPCDFSHARPRSHGELRSGKTSGSSPRGTARPGAGSHRAEQECTDWRTGPREPCLGARAGACSLASWASLWPPCLGYWASGARACCFAEFPRSSRPDRRLLWQPHLNTTSDSVIPSAGGGHCQQEESISILPHPSPQGVLGPD